MVAVGSVARSAWWTSRRPCWRPWKWNRRSYIRDVRSRRFSDSPPPPHLYSCRLWPWKLVRGGDPDNPTDRLFDLAADPLEQNDLSALMPDTLEMVRDSLQAIVLRRTAVGVEAHDPRMDPETLERLRSLGYIR